MQARVFLVSSRPLIRSMLAEALRTRCSAVIESEVGTVEEVEKGLEQATLLIVDLTPTRRGIFDALVKLRQDKPHLQVLMVSSASGDYVLHQATKIGASIIHECDQPETLPAAVAAVSSGAFYCSPEVLARRNKLPQVAQLTSRELAVVELASASIGDDDAGRRLGVVGSTVESHRKNAMKKLCLCDWAELQGFGLKAGINSIDDIRLANKTRRTSLRRKLHNGDPRR